VIEKIRTSVSTGNIEWQKHALERMLERGISRKRVKNILLSGEIIDAYPGDKPYSSFLVYGQDDGDVIHVVAAYDDKSGTCFIITVYRPDLKYFESNLKTRRKK
jgi:hypothetical protein